MGSANGAPFEPFFLQAANGERFCVFYPVIGTPRGAVVHLHAFGEEMNKSRHMVALQSRMFAARGFAVLQIDLFGCGDSSGDFGEARWEIWKQDVAVAVQWVERRMPGPLYLWGLRLGSLLALDYAATSASSFAGFILWQPVISGQQFLTQFLRLRVANEMISAGGAKTGTQELRNRLASGEALEIAGYDLAPELAYAIDYLKLVDLTPNSATPVYWLEIVAEANHPLLPASRRVTDAWVARGIDVRSRATVGSPFWNTIEIVECHELLAHTLDLVAENQK